ncbi:GNAT family N-acetyltransferase [Prauserella cavernicola]|uniref:Lysine N-acyltransferase MbtK n=1 Tax=Prauserella cavernicola TaxID=2800127 RepID=A0A934QNY0_9PSEU|nr:GNAT family N-acetyltransferase [Prauserella cavernicola]MBK1783452.1 GNAT family N-acetyltransferase [Prauserella cavernicola]
MLSFRRTTREDLPVIQRWLRTPHVDRFWQHDTSDEAVERDFAGSIEGTEPSEDFVVELDGRPIGFAQRCRIFDYPDDHQDLIELADVPAGALTIDYFLGEPDVLGQGLGTGLVREFTRLCWAEYPDAPAIVVPVVASNVASWSALRSAGYNHTVTGHLEPENAADDGQHHVLRADRPR